MDNQTYFSIPPDVEAKGNEVSREAEEQLCGDVLRGGTDTFKQVRDITSPDFFRVDPLQNLWRAFERLDAEGLKIDLFTVQDELERQGVMGDFANGPWHGSVYLANMRGNGVPDNVLSHAETVADYAAKRELYRLFSNGAYQSLNGRRAKDIMVDALASLSKLTIYSAQDEYTAPVSSALSEAYDWAARAAQNKILGVPTGFLDLDRMLGSLIAENVYLVAGRPGQGKTAFLISVGRNAARKHNKRVAIFSLEMSRLQVGQRLIAQEAEVDLHKIITGKMNEDEWNRFNTAIETIERLPIVINDLSEIAINGIRQTARKLKANGGLDLVIVDYIQLANSEGKRAERRELEVSEVSRGLKYLARELEVPVLAAAQLSRAVEQRADKRPILSDLRESGSLEQDSYAVMFLHKPDETKSNVVELSVSKHRNGPTGSCELIFQPEYAQFQNAAARVFNFQ